MAVRFVVSRAGGGKTAHCLEAVRDRLRTSATDGPPLILLVPEQAALQTERALIETPDIGGYTRCEVLSFRRLAFRVLMGTGGTDREEVSPLSRLMVLRYLLGRRKRSLKVYGRLADRGGFVARLADQFVELFVQAVEPDDLRAVAANADSADRTLADKLHDLSLLYADYLTYLADGRVDTDQYMDLARRRLPQATWLRGAEVWADGFAVFSRQEERLLAALAGLAARVEITFLLDPDASVLPPAQGRPEPGQLFHQIEDTVNRFARSLTESGVAIEPTIRLRPTRLPRFVHAPDLALLESRLFAAPPVPPASRRLATDSGSTHSQSASVRIVEAATRRVEVDRCVAQIQTWVQRDREPLRYRDVAVIVRQIEVYHELLSAAFDAHEIPYFLDRRRPVAHHPLVELIRVLTALCANDLDVTSVRLLLKTGLTGLDFDDADRLENCILAHGIRSRRVWLSADPWALRPRRSSRTAGDEPAPKMSADAERINALRDRLIAPMRGLLERSAGGARATGQEWAGALFGTLEALVVPDQLEQWARSAEADGRLDEAEEHRQVWRDAIALLDELVRALGGEPMSIRQFGEVLDTGLSQFTLGLAPPSLDQVLIGSVERSRHPDIRAAIILGFNEGQFPTLATDAGVLTDRENEVLRRHDLPIGRGREMRLDQERLLTYIAVTRPRERLQISYAAADEDGRALAPSPYLAFVLGALPNARIESVGDPTETRETWSIGTAGELSARLALELAQRPDRESDDAELRARWNTLYNQARHSTGCPAVLARALSSLTPAAPSRLTTTAVDTLYGDDRSWSATQLETVAWCPFKHFAQHGLRLARRDVLGLEPVDVGRLHHAVLEQVVNDLIADKQRLADLDDAALSDRLATAAEMHATRLEQEAMLSAPRTDYVLHRTARDLQRAAAAQRKVSAAGRFRPAATEVPFGFPDRPNSLPALEIETPGGRHIRLRGFVDRVDVADGPDGALGMIVDYKRSGSKPLNLFRVMAGLELQLMTYLLVLADHGDALLDQPTMPAGTFYFNIKPEYKTVAHPDEAPTQPDAVEGPYRPRGLFDGAHLGAFDASLSTGSSRVVSAFRKQDGSLGKLSTTDVADTPQIRGLLNAARQQLGALADQVLDGEIGVTPASLGNTLPCNWCPYNGVCRFEPITGRTRTIPKLPRDQILRDLGDE